MDKGNQDINESTETKSFAELLAETQINRDRLQPGQKVDAIIVKISPEWIFLDLGEKSEGYLDRRELLDEQGNITVREGDTIRAYFLSSHHNEKLFTTKVVGGEAGRFYLEEAWQSGIPVEGIVEKEIKGGYEIKIAGEIRCFCPHSQMGLTRDENAGDYLGKRLPFTITEYGEKGKNILLSRKEILKEEQEEKKKALKKSLIEGMTVKGKITSIQKFGAFVDIGGIQGLLPVSEIGWSHVEDIHEYLNLGQEVDVSILKLDWEKDRISLSLKKTLSDPWDNVEKKYMVGTCHTGTVSRLAKFGAFVSLEGGIDGLLHISKVKTAKRIKHLSDLFKEGQILDVQIEAVDKDKKRISLILASASEDEGNIEGGYDYRQYMDKPAKALGSWEDLLKGKIPVKKKG